MVFKSNKGDFIDIPVLKNMGSNPKVFYADCSYGLDEKIVKTIVKGILIPHGFNGGSVERFKLSGNWHYVK
jgi:hypothetical protein